MRTVTKEYKVYQYNELSEQAKEVVKKWYLEGQESCIFTDMVNEDLYNLFGKNDLEVQYSLSSCQGDGFNIYGEVEAEKIFDCLEKHNSGSQLEKFENILTNEEKKTILEYAEYCYIELDENNRYCYSLADRIDIAESWYYVLEDYIGEENINKDILEKFENLVRGMFSTLCNYYEEWGYKFFYEIEEEELEEICNGAEWEFLENGKLFIG